MGDTAPQSPGIGESHLQPPGRPDVTADTSSTAALAKPPSLNRLIVAATIGNVLEWFDFVVYGFFDVTIAEVFFLPATRPCRC